MLISFSMALFFWLVKAIGGLLSFQVGVGMVGSRRVDTALEGQKCDISRRELSSCMIVNRGI